MLRNRIRQQLLHDLAEAAAWTPDHIRTTAAALLATAPAVRGGPPSGKVDHVAEAMLPALSPTEAALLDDGEFEAYTRARENVAAVVRGWLRPPDPGPAVEVNALPVRILSDHLPLPHARTWPVPCLACAEPWPCPTFQRHLLAQADVDPTDDARHSKRLSRMIAHLTIWQLRLMTRPELKNLGREVHVGLFGWIDAALLAQNKLERIREAVSTGARRAIARIPVAAANLRESLFTPRNGARPVLTRNDRFTGTAQPVIGQPSAEDVDRLPQRTRRG